jgi:uncharacterized membrane protein YeaQ/YmgE (transglycosylase-associated protein family)
MGIVTWIVLGLVAGVLARFIGPAKVPGGIIVTILIGIGGALLGGFVATQLGWGDISGFNLRSVLIAVGGAVLLLVIFRLLLVRMLLGK